MYKYLLCLRYLMSRYIALVSIVSVMLGVMTMIVVNSVMGGFREKMRDRLHGVLADVVVESTTLDGFRDPQLVMEHVARVCGDRIAAMTPVIEFFGMLHYQNQGKGPHFTRMVKLIGIDPEGRAAVGEFRDHLQNPRNRVQPTFDVTPEAARWWEEHPDPRDADRDDPKPEERTMPSIGVIIGYQIATYRTQGMVEDETIIPPGQELVLTTAMAGRPPKPVDFRTIVVDHFKSDMSEYDSQYVFVPYRELQRIRGMGDRATGIQIRLKNDADTRAVVRELQRSFNPIDYDVQSWEDKQGALLQAVKVEAFLLNIILFFIIANAGFGILAIFFMIVVEKTRDIGILKALGASNGGVMGVFLGYGLALGIVGCGFGALGGILFALFINPIEATLAAWTGWELFPRDIYYFKDIPVVLKPFTVVWVVLGALSIAVAASVLPARRAARLHPVEALRHA